MFPGFLSSRHEVSASVQRSLSQDDLHHADIKEKKNVNLRTDLYQTRVCTSLGNYFLSPMHTPKSSKISGNRTDIFANALVHNFMNLV